MSCDFQPPFIEGGAIPESNILSCQNVQYGTVPGLILKNLILVFMGLKKKSKIDNYAFTSYY